MDLMYHDEGFLDPIDYYYDDNSFNDLLNHHDSAAQLYLTGIFELCIIPTVSQAFNSLLPVLISSMLIKLIVVKTHLSISHIHFVNVFVSIAVYTYLYDMKLVAYLTALVVIIYLIQSVFDSLDQKRLSVVIFSMLHLFVGKILLLTVSEWNSIKGIEMLLIMKAISFASDNNQLDKPAYTSYMISISTTFFGPWITFEEHLATLTSKKVYLKNFFKNFLVSFLCLIASSCLLNTLEFTYEFSVLFQIYLEAMSFRLSNYFVCYFSQSVCDLNGLSTKITQGHYVSKPIVQPMFIEFPRSLVEVVTSWNLPMHYWLKNCIFVPVKQMHGTNSALFLTYFGSVMIHGFDTNISLILFSLGFYTYAEYSLRKNLSVIFNCCSEARKCRPRCGHGLGGVHPLPVLINLTFVALNVYHLAYLGQVFFYNNSEEKEFNSFEIAAALWSKTYYSSHLIAVFSLILSLLIKNLM